MTESKGTTLHQEVEAWWNANPFSYGATEVSSDQVGTIDLSDMDVAYFEKLERKFRQHSKDAAQEDGAPLFSNFIDYRWLKGKRVLDIAVGSGFSMVEFIRQGAGSVTGIDLTDFGVLHAKKNMEVRNMKADILKMDAQQMSFPDHSFDFVCAWGCYMHMPDTEKAISETYRVLKPHGRTIAYMYNKDSWPFWFNTILLKGVVRGDLFRYKGDITAITSRYADGFTRGGNPLTKFYSKRNVKRMYHNAGFKNITVIPFRVSNEPNHWPMGTFPVFRYLPSSWKKFLSRWGYGQVVLAEK